MEPIVETKSLRVEFRAQNSGQAKKVAVKDLNLGIGAGEVFGFLGPNGAGKTTTMNVLLGFVHATSGAAFLFGVDVREPIARQRIGYLPELTYYYKFLTAEELLRKIDYPALRRQKHVLMAFQANAAMPYDRQALEGIVEILDHIQDWAVDEAGYPEQDVFGEGIFSEASQAA